MTDKSAAAKREDWKIEPLDIADPRTWPPEVTSLKVRCLPDGRRVVTGRQFADLPGCTTSNLRQLKLGSAHEMENRTLRVAEPP